MALLPKRAPLSPERTALADAIKARAARQSEADAREAAKAHAEAAVYDARRAVDAAHAAVREAPEAAVRHLLATAAGTAGERPLTAREARDALTDAEHHLEAALAASDESNATARSHDLTDLRLTEAVQAVLRTEGAAVTNGIAATVARLQHELVVAGQALAYLIDIQAFPVSDQIGASYGKPSDAAIRTTAYRLQSPPMTWHEITPRTDGAAPWRAAVAALSTDATAPLPGVAS